MPFNSKKFTRVGVKGSEGSFIMATYDATETGANGASEPLATITAGTGAGYFPETVLPPFVDGQQITGAAPEPPIPMLVVAVKHRGATAGQPPAVSLVAVNTILATTSTGSGASTVTTYNRARTSDGTVKTRAQAMGTTTTAADNTND